MKRFLVLALLMVSVTAMASDDYADYEGTSYLYNLSGTERMVTVEGDVAQKLFEETSVLIDFQTHSLGNGMYKITVVKTHQTPVVSCFKTQSYRMGTNEPVGDASYSCGLTLNVE